MSRPTPDDPRTAEVLTSYEGRWFFSGDVPAAVERAFRAGSTTERGWPPPRTDRYLPFAADMGIKVRAEPGRPPRLELKGRSEWLGPVTLGSGVVTVASTWIKWSYALSDAPAILQAALQDEGATIPVEKTRILRRFRLDPEEPAREVSQPVRLSRGVQLELTRLRLPGSDPSPETAWTLSFEAFPLGPGLEDAVHVALAEPLAALAATGLTLHESRSASYPAWLLSPRRPPGPAP